MEKREGRPKLDVTCLANCPLQPGHKTPSNTVLLHVLSVIVTQHLPDTLVPSTALFGSFSCMLLFAATNLNWCLLLLLVLLATLDSTSYEALLHFVEP